MQSPSWRGFLLLFVLFIAVAGSAQEAPPPRFSEEMVVRVIDVDVVVTDRKGNPITGLTREDFELFEDGKRVEIAYFSSVVGGKIEGMPAAAPTASETTPATAAVDPSRTPLTWVVFLDQTSIDPGKRKQALQQLRIFLDRGVETGDRAMVASMDGMAFRVRQNLTGDRKQLLEAVAQLEKDRIHRGSAANETVMIRKEINFVERDDKEWEFMAQTIGNRINILIEEEAQRTKNAISSLSALLDLLAHVEGRLALVYVGAGFSTLPGLQLSEDWRGRFGSMMTWSGAPQPEIHETALKQEISRLFDRISATRTTLYAIHAGAAAFAVSADDPGTLGDLRLGGDFPGGSNFNDRAQMTEAGSAREMAEHTGGRFFKANPRLADQLDAMRRDLSHYYALGYKPAGEPGPLRNIEVRVKRDGIRVRHRDAVRERTPHEQATGLVVAAMVKPPHFVVAKPVTPRDPVATAAVDPNAANPLGVTVEARRPMRESTGRDSLLPFNFSMQLDKLTFARKGAALRAELVLHFALASPDGTLWPLESREQTLEIPQSDLPSNPDQHISYAWHLDLSPLRIPAKVPVRASGMRLTVAVEDRATNIRSVITVPVPKRGSG